MAEMQVIAQTLLTAVPFQAVKVFWVKNKVFFWRTSIPLFTLSPLISSLVQPQRKWSESIVILDTLPVSRSELDSCFSFSFVNPPCFLEIWLLTSLSQWHLNINPLLIISEFLLMAFDLQNIAQIIVCRYYNFRGRKVKTFQSTLKNRIFIDYRHWNASITAIVITDNNWQVVQ